MLIKLLIRKYLRGEITPVEQAELEAWLDAAPENRALLESFGDEAWMGQVLTRIAETRKVNSGAWGQFQARLIQRIEQPVEGIEPERDVVPVRRMGWRRWAVAAAILIVFAGAGILWLVRGTDHGRPVAAARAMDITAPVTTRATITLGNGQQVYLDSAVAGRLAMQGNTEVIRGEKGEIAYQAAGSGGTGRIMYNTLTNPRGSQVIDIKLADGTHVWLNAASSIRYPTVFTGEERLVEVTGEAYFEVAQNVDRPFRVKKANSDWTVLVLGTHFNINTYDDEAVSRVTLLEGRVKVSVGSRLGLPGKEAAIVLKPGEQAEVGTGIGINKGVDPQAVMAWKNGLFSFVHTDLQTVMRQLARWYNVDVFYEGKLPERSFSGSIDRNLTLDQVLRILTNSRVHYRIEPGNINKLIIRP